MIHKIKKLKGKVFNPPNKWGDPNVHIEIEAAEPEEAADGAE
jgi:hypothetical protein